MQELTPWTEYQLMHLTKDQYNAIANKLFNNLWIKKSGKKIPSTAQAAQVMIYLSQILETDFKKNIIATQLKQMDQDENSSID